MKKIVLSLFFVIFTFSFGLADIIKDDNPEKLTQDENRTYRLLPGEETDYINSGMLKMENEVTVDQEPDPQVLLGEEMGSPYDSRGQFKDQRSTQEEDTYQPLPGEQAEDITPEGKLADERSTPQ